MTQQQLQWGKRAVLFAATGFGVGRAPIAPGTFGTLVGILFYVAASWLTPLYYVVVVLALFIVGMWLCEIAETELGEHDHPSIVWDEIVGFLITMFLAPPGWRWIVLGFLLFRLFDIWKPFPIQHLERVPGGLGAMADDALAGVYACLVLQTLVWLGSY